MKKLFLLLPFAAMLGFASCENEADDADADGRDTAVVVDEPDTLVIRERETYRTNLQRDIDRMQARIDSMDNRAESKTNKEWQETKADLQMRIDRAKADLQETGDKADAEWDQFKTNLDREMDTLRMEWDSLDLDIDVKNKKK
jgi:peptidoglycan hydrolase CwlO-like protein